MRATLALLLCLVGPAASQQTAVFELPRFESGLYTRDSANAIPANSLSLAINVLLDVDAAGVPVRRKGYAKYNTTAITNAKTVRGLWAFNANDGSKYLTAVSSAAFYKTAGDGTFSAITGASSYSSLTEWDCTSLLGKQWCADGNTVWYWDGTSTKTVTGAPAGDLIDNFRNRVVMAGITAQKGRLRLSGELDGEDWTVPTSIRSTSPANIAVGGVNDGNEITCLLGVYQDVFLIGKLDSLWGLYGFDTDDFSLREISREVGCLEETSVQEKNGCKYWLSKRGVERMCGSEIARVSDPIRDQIDTLIASAGNTITVTDTSQTDFEAGNLTASMAGAPMSATISPGNVVPTTFSVTDTSASDFGAGTLSNVSTSTVPGAVVLISSRVFDQFTDGNYTSAPVWTSPSGSPTVAAGHLAGGSSESVIRLVANGSGGTAPMTRLEFKVFMQSSGGSNDVTATWGPGCEYGVTANCWRLAVGWSSSSANKIELYKESTLIFDHSGLLSNGTTQTIALTRSAAGTYQLYVDSVAYDSATNTTLSSVTAVNVSVDFLSANRYSNMDDFAIEFGYVSSGTFSSRAFDTAFSTPTWGLLTVSSSVPTSTTLTYDIQTATSSSGDWDVTANVANTTATFAATQRRYVRYRANFANTVSSGTPQLNDANLTASTTGYFIAQCRNPGATATSWGNFTCTKADVGGSLTFWTVSGNSCNEVTRGTAAWTAQTNGAPVAVSLLPYVGYRVLFDMDVASDTPTLNDCSIAWNEGATRPPVATAVYQDRYYMAYTSSTASGAANDHVLVLDRNDIWTEFDNHTCYSLAQYQRGLYCGSSSNNGRVWKMDNGNDDDGAAFTSVIRTPAYDMGFWEGHKVFDNLYLLLEPTPDSAIPVSMTVAYRIDRGTETYTLGTVDLNESPSSLLTAKLPFPQADVVAGHTLSLDITNTGTNSPWRLFGAKVYHRRQEAD